MVGQGRVRGALSAAAVQDVPREEESRTGENLQSPRAFGGTDVIGSRLHTVGVDSVVHMSYEDHVRIQGCLHEVAPGERKTGCGERKAGFGALVGVSL